MAKKDITMAPMAAADGLISEADLRECLDALHRFALKLTRNEDEALDLVQDCLERCWRKQHLFDGRNLRSWMFTVCHRVFMNKLRQTKARGHMVEFDDAPPQALGIGARQDNIVYYYDMVAGVSQLPPSDQQVLSLIAVDGLRYDEVATRLDVPVGTVRSRLSRARARLRTILGEVTPTPAVA